MTADHAPQGRVVAEQIGRDLAALIDRMQQLGLGWPDMDAVWRDAIKQARSTVECEPNCPACNKPPKPGQPWTIS